MTFISKAMFDDPNKPAVPTNVRSLKLERAVNANAKAVKPQITEADVSNLFFNIYIYIIYYSFHIYS